MRGREQAVEMYGRQKARGLATLHYENAIKNII
jgi:hypothetical protein